VLVMESCTNIILNLHVPSEDQSGDKEQLILRTGVCILLVCRHNMKILLGNFTERVWRRDVLHKTLHEIDNQNGVRALR
jgi:hypothetical protein